MISVSILREFFRNYHAFRAYYESTGIDEVIDPATGDIWTFWDVQYLLEQVQFLPARQRDTIVLCLVENRREVDVAIAFGLKPSNPVLMYATTGLEKIVEWAMNGKLPRYQAGGWMSQHLQEAV